MHVKSSSLYRFWWNWCWWILSSLCTRAVTTRRVSAAPWTQDVVSACRTSKWHGTSAGSVPQYPSGCISSTLPRTTFTSTASYCLQTDEQVWSNIVIRCQGRTVFCYHRRQCQYLNSSQYYINSFTTVIWASYYFVSIFNNRSSQHFHCDLLIHRCKKFRLKCYRIVLKRSPENVTKIKNYYSLCAATEFWAPKSSPCTIVPNLLSSCLNLGRWLPELCSNWVLNPETVKKGKGTVSVINLT